MYSPDIEELEKDKHGHMKACFALHDVSKRNDLREKWLDWKKTFSQPVEEIRSYFGEEIGLYFAFLRKCTEIVGFSLLIETAFRVLQLESSLAGFAWNHLLCRPNWIR